MGEASVPPKLGGVARRRFIRRAGVVPRTKSTSYRGSAQEPPLPCFALSGSHSLRSCPSAPGQGSFATFFLGAASPPNLGGEFHSDASRPFLTRVQRSRVDNTSTLFGD